MQYLQESWDEVSPDMWDAILFLSWSIAPPEHKVSVIYGSWDAVLPRLWDAIPPGNWVQSLLKRGTLSMLEVEMQSFLKGGM
jgi:hypothetical protein